MNNLRELRKENGYSQEQMAAELGVSLYVSESRAGERKSGA